jgi:phosphoadenosine phosphosulfate reductase
MMHLPFIEEYVSSHSIDESLRYISRLFPSGAVRFSSSLGQEDQVLTDMIFRNKHDVEVFTIDTGRLFAETYDLLDRTEYRYQSKIKLYFPEAQAVQEFVQENGINGFYESSDNRKSCCEIRKVEPLNRALKNARVWITGLRADQSDNRKNMPLVEWNAAKNLYKFNPLLHWTYEEVLDYIKQNHVPYNALHDQGFISIGCAPCTRAIKAGEDARSGRWWWEMSKKECGLHVA